jgi:hypothetical protein
MDAEKLLAEILHKEWMDDFETGLVRAQHKATISWLSTVLSEMGLELRPAAKENNLYKYRLAAIGEKRILAHFNSCEEVTTYLKDLQSATHVL